MAEVAEEEGFLGRWSRLKRGAREAPPAETAVETAPPVPVEAPAGPAVDGEPPVLPPLDSLDADSDYTAFLKREVPAELRRLALRKAWASDPTIAGFRGFGEYDWDYNAPGYGALHPTDDIKRLVDAIFPDREPPPLPPDAPPEPVVADAEPVEEGSAVTPEDEAPEDGAPPATS